MEQEIQIFAVLDQNSVLRRCTCQPVIAECRVRIDLYYGTMAIWQCGNALQCDNVAMHDARGMPHIATCHAAKFIVTQCYTGQPVVAQRRAMIDLYYGTMAILVQYYGNISAEVVQWWGNSCLILPNQSQKMQVITTWDLNEEEMTKTWPAKTYNSQ